MLLPCKTRRHWSYSKFELRNFFFSPQLWEQPTCVVYFDMTHATHTKKNFLMNLWNFQELFGFFPEFMSWFFSRIFCPDFPQNFCPDLFLEFFVHIFPVIFEFLSGFFPEFLSWIFPLNFLPWSFSGIFGPDFFRETNNSFSRKKAIFFHFWVTHFFMKNEKKISHLLGQCLDYMSKNFELDFHPNLRDSGLKKNSIRIVKIMNNFCLLIKNYFD